MRVVRVLAVAMMVLTTAVVAGCKNPEPIQRLPELRYNHLSPMTLDVGGIDIVRQYQPPIQPPNVEHLMPVSPERAVTQWVEDRLRASGHSARRAVFTIREASVVEKRLAVDQGFTGAFKNQQAEQYDARLDVSLEIRDENGRFAGEAVATNTRSRTTAEDTTVNARDRLWHGLTEALVNDMNATLDGAIRQHLARYLMH